MAEKIVTVNCDMGEGFGVYSLGNDSQLLEIVQVANVGCGMHGGDPTVIANTVAMAVQQGVAVGAHPSFPDRQGFGRREMKMEPNELHNFILFQIGSISAFLQKERGKLSHVKPHGSLYGHTSRVEESCRALCRAIQVYGVGLIGMAGTLHEKIAKEFDIPFIPEFFADLDYSAEGSLIITRKHKGWDPEVAASRVKRALEQGTVLAIDGVTEVPVRCETICVHSDTPNAVELAKAVVREVDAFNHKLSKTLPQETKGTVLIANRGEIACRIARSCKKLNLKTIVIFSTEDRESLHISAADHAVPLPVGSSYTSINDIIEICKKEGVTMVHPGYGFLSENAEFCRAVEEAGITFLGPSCQTIRDFGAKHVARGLAQKAGVPIVPGSPLLTTEEDAIAAANQVGYPVLLKASYGGGGIGMRICLCNEDVVEGFAKAGSVGKSHFGNEGVFLEKYFPRSHHIEVQIFGDGEGHVLHLGERECSIQRRYQKVIEEAPSPFVCLHPTPSEYRKKICDTAVALAQSIKYRSAGTVEFLVVDDETSPSHYSFYFLEMNTRLQVEHGVTELVNSVDLVEWMLLLGLNQPQFLHDFHWRPHGFAIEARVYAENPSRNFQPSSGILTNVSWPSRSRCRVDTWVRTGTRISHAFDPLLAKVMVHSRLSRLDTVEKMEEVLSFCSLEGPPHNLPFLSHIVKQKGFKEGRTTTLFLKEMDPYVSDCIEVIGSRGEVTIQDLPGRLPLRVYGIQPSGPIDPLSFRIANILVGNNEVDPGLEVAGEGLTLLFHTSMWMSFTGASHYEVTIEKQVKEKQEEEGSRGIVTYQPYERFYVEKGSRFKLQTNSLKEKNSSGCRCYLSFGGGGLAVSDYLGSKSTFIGGGYGGHQGRSLRAGDELYPRENSPLQNEPSVPLSLPSNWQPYFPQSGDNWVLRVLIGPYAHPDYLTLEDMTTMLTSEWKVHYNSNRMGVRLVGPIPNWGREDGGEGGSHPSNIIDCPYPLGGLNFTGNSPVILTVDGPTQGGFVCPLTIISADLWKVGQMRPGDRIQMISVTSGEAREIKRQVENYVSTIQHFCSFSSYIDTVPPPIVQWTNENPVSLPNPLPDGILYRGLGIPGEKRKGGGDVELTIRQAGDSSVLLLFGSAGDYIQLDIAARIRLLQLELGLVTNTNTLATSPTIEGLCDAIPAPSTLLVRFDPSQIPLEVVLQILVKTNASLPSTMRFPSRKIYLPIALRDRWSKLAEERYMAGIRSKAAYLPSNIDFIGENNGLPKEGPSCVTEKLVSSSWLVMGVGFFLGCPFTLPVDPRCRLTVPKYNPARTWTADGAVGLGGSMMAIYPMEGPGGYQLFGRTIPTWDTFSTREPFSETVNQPWLLNFFDEIIFERVSEDQLLQSRDDFYCGTYQYRIEESVVDLGEMVEFEKSVWDEVLTFRQQQREARKKMLQIEKDFLKEEEQNSSNQIDPSSSESQFEEGHEPVECSVTGMVLKCPLNEGDIVVENETVVMALEAMKMEVSVKAPFSGVFKKYFVSEKSIVEAGQLICLIVKE